MKKGFIPTFLRTMLLGNLRRYLMNNISTVLYYPPGYELLDIPHILKEEKAVGCILDPVELVLRYYSNNLDRLFDLLHKKIEKELVYIKKADELLDAYPKSKEDFLRFFISVKSMPVIVGTSNAKLYKYLEKIGYAPIILSELSLMETYNLVVKSVGLTIDSLDLSEGNLGVIKLLAENKISEFIEDMILDRILKLESGQRIVFSLLSTRITVGQLTKKLGSQTYVFLKRLIDKGEVLRLGGRRGNYIVRNPIYRIVISKKLGLKKPSWYVAGFMYLLIKLFLSIDRSTSLNTLTETIYISPISKIKRIDKFTVRMMDITNTKYTIHLATKENLGRLDKLFKYEEDIKVLVYPFSLTSYVTRKMRREKILVLDSNSVSLITQKLGFPRRL